jgi:hypothetical protein
MPMSLSWGLPTACQVGSAVVLQMKNFYKKKTTCTVFKRWHYENGVRVKLILALCQWAWAWLGGCQTACQVGSAVVLQIKNFKKKKTTCTVFKRWHYENSVLVKLMLALCEWAWAWLGGCQTACQVGSAVVLQKEKN